MVDHLIDVLTKVEAVYLNWEIVLMGDLNRLKTSSVSRNLRNSDTDLVLSKPNTEFKKINFSYHAAFFGTYYGLKQMP